MNRIAIILDPNGNIERVVSDEPVDVYTVSESAPNDRVYQLTTMNVAGWELAGDTDSAVEAVRGERSRP